jgi:ribosomal protein S18 acetylase RimI-like enzyme
MTGPVSPARPPVVVRRLGPNDAPAYILLRAESLAREPLHFGSSPETDRFKDETVARARLDGGERSPVFGAFDGAELVGAVGLVCESALKAAHRATVWGTYVDPSQRGRGIGRALMTALIEHARKLAGIDWVQLDVSSVADEARRLYERCGFVAWGCEPDGLRANGASTDVLHMALRLERTRST